MKDLLGRHLTRRQFMKVMAVGTGASVLIGCVPTAVPIEVGLAPFGFQMMWRNDSEQANLHVAKKAGYYAEEGLEVTLHEGGGGIDEPLVTLAGTSNIVVGAVSGTANIIAPIAENDMPFVIIGTLMQKKPECYLTLKKYLSDEEWQAWEAGELSPLAMKGDVVGEGGRDRFKLQALMKSVGLTMDDIEFQSTDSATALPLMTGAVRWLSTWTINQPWQLKAEGIPYAYILVSDWAVPLHGHVLFTTKERMRDRRDIIAGFLKATFRGLKRTIEDVDFAMEAVREHSGGYDEPEKWRWLIEQMNDISVSEQTEEHGLGWVDKGEVQAVCEFLNENAGTPIPDVDDVVDMSLHPGKVDI